MHERSSELILVSLLVRLLLSYILAAAQSGNAKPKQIPITFDTQAIAALQLKLFKL